MEVGVHIKLPHRRNSSLMNMPYHNKLTKLDLKLMSKERSRPDPFKVQRSARGSYSTHSLLQENLTRLRDMKKSNMEVKLQDISNEKIKPKSLEAARHSDTTNSLKYRRGSKMRVGELQSLNYNSSSHAELSSSVKHQILKRKRLEDHRTTSVGNYSTESPTMKVTRNTGNGLYSLRIKTDLKAGAATSKTSVVHSHSQIELPKHRSLMQRANPTIRSPRKHPNDNELSAEKLCPELDLIINAKLCRCATPKYREKKEKPKNASSSKLQPGSPRVDEWFKDKYTIKKPKKSRSQINTISLTERKANSKTLNKRMTDRRRLNGSLNHASPEVQMRKARQRTNKKAIDSRNQNKTTLDQKNAMGKTLESFRVMCNPKSSSQNDFTYRKQSTDLTLTGRNQHENSVGDSFEGNRTLHDSLTIEAISGDRDRAVREDDEQYENLRDALRKKYGPSSPKVAKRGGFDVKSPKSSQPIQVVKVRYRQKDCGSKKRYKEEGPVPFLEADVSFSGSDLCGF